MTFGGQTIPNELASRESLSASDVVNVLREPCAGILLINSASVIFTLAAHRKGKFRAVSVAPVDRPDPELRPTASFFSRWQ